MMSSLPKCPVRARCVTLGASLWYTVAVGTRARNLLKGVSCWSFSSPPVTTGSTQDRTYGKLTIEPFEPGFALTVGNAYRRVLLSAIHGAAPTWVKIENVLHEFSHLPGVTEDTLDIMMNLRKVVFALHVNRPEDPPPEGPGRPAR